MIDWTSPVEKKLSAELQAVTGPDTARLCWKSLPPLLACKPITAAISGYMVNTVSICPSSSVLTCNDQLGRGFQTGLAMIDDILQLAGNLANLA